MLPSIIVGCMDSTSPELSRTTGEYKAFAPDVPKFFLGTVARRRTLWLGHNAAGCGYRQSDQTQSPVLAC